MDNGLSTNDSGSFRNLVMGVVGVLITAGIISSIYLDRQTSAAISVIQNHIETIKKQVQEINRTAQDNHSGIIRLNILNEINSSRLTTIEGKVNANP